MQAIALSLGQDVVDEEKKREEERAKQKEEEGRKKKEEEEKQRKVEEERRRLTPLDKADLDDFSNWYGHHLTSQLDRRALHGTLCIYSCMSLHVHVCTCTCTCIWVCIECVD